MAHIVEISEGWQDSTI